MSNPKKEHGTTRHLGVPEHSTDRGIKEYLSQLNKTGVKSELCYVNNQNGGHVIWHEGHRHPEEGILNNEYRFAKALADRGYLVHLLPEVDKEGSATLRLTLSGDKTFIDGKVKHLTGQTLYEQWSPTIANSKYGILSGLEHASDKGCKLLAIFDPTNVLSREHIKLGMEKYEEGRNNGRNYIEMKGVITYNARGEFNSWYWEK